MDKVIKSLCDGWKLCFEENRICKNYADDINTIEKIERSGFTKIDASVPGNFELDLLECGLIDDPLYSTNSFKLHKWEYYHVWYYNTFDLEDINGDEYIPKMESTNLLRAKVTSYLAIPSRSPFSCLLP